ncbi:hypothetical protein ACUNV4_30180 [Granulosicoccus sp. 3-233]|uniref:hypothetical protein n=1 Tax=Granulosicoccus sp. 3-233 TaxID=3417969 RepID=UPI003D32674C
MSLAIEQRPERLPLSVACKVLGLNRSSVYQRQRGLVGDKANRSRKNSVQPRALSEQERRDIRDTLHSEEYRNQPPAEVCISAHLDRSFQFIVTAYFGRS